MGKQFFFAYFGKTRLITGTHLLSVFIEYFNYETWARCTSKLCLPINKPWSASHWHINTCKNWNCSLLTGFSAFGRRLVRFTKCVYLQICQHINYTVTDNSNSYSMSNLMFINDLEYHGNACWHRENNIKSALSEHCH